MHESDPAKNMVACVEYNQVEAFLKSQKIAIEDVPDENGNSFFPGNNGSYIFKLDDYVANLKRTKGVVSEFINPKYADESRCKFKAPTRIECITQDYARTVCGS